MRRRSATAAGLLVIASRVFGGADMSSGQADAGWVTLNDGATGLDNWNRVCDANWRAEDGASVADKGKGGLLRLEERLQGLPAQGGVLGGSGHDAQGWRPVERLRDHGAGSGGWPVRGGTVRSSSAMAPTMRQAGPSSGARCRSSLCSAAQDLVWTDLSAL